MSGVDELDFVPFGRSAFVVRGPRGHLLAVREAALRLPDVAETQLSYSELLVKRAAGSSLGAIETALRRVPPPGPEMGGSPRQGCREHYVEVVYDGADLGAVARACGLREREVVDLHTSAAYEVLAIGFQPGFAYLGFLPEKLRLPRRATPRTRVPAGSVAIAADQTAVYPHASPGGWHLLGRTDFPCFDAEARGLTPFAVGDRVQFAVKASGR